MNPATSPESRSAPAYGGQAVIEGVMMRGAAACATAVRAPDGTLRFDVHHLDSAVRRRYAKWPLVRGLFVLFDTVRLGFQSLSFSASVQAGPQESISGAPVAATMILSALVGIGLFFLLPAAVAFILAQSLGISGAWGVLLEGLLRLALLLGYLWAVGRIPEVRRVYAYHGAEHKTIHAYEAGRPLRVEEVAPFPREHPRCGTAFLLTIVVLSIVLFSLLGPMPLLARLVSRLLLIPVLAAAAYEYIRWTARLEQVRWAAPLLAGNLALQRLTTREPERDMIEVAIAAFEAMQEAEKHPPVETSA